MIESVPPRLYGGTERVVSYLTEDLLAQGHEVTLFASGDSITAANLVPCCRQALRLDTAVSDVVPYYMLMLDKVRSHAAAFDVLHFHIDHFHFPIFRHLPIATLTTLHGRQDHRDCKPFYAGFSDMPLISISDSQRAPLPHANFVATDHNGLPEDLHEAGYRQNGGRRKAIPERVASSTADNSRADNTTRAGRAGSSKVAAVTRAASTRRRPGKTNRSASCAAAD